MGVMQFLQLYIFIGGGGGHNFIHDNVPVHNIVKVLITDSGENSIWIYAHTPANKWTMLLQIKVNIISARWGWR